MENLKKFCEVIRQRRLNADFTPTTCIFCEANMKGYDALQTHIFEDHNIVLPPFDDIEDIDAFLAAVKGMVVLPDNSGYKCLNTGLVFPTLAELEEHLASSAVAGANIANPEGRTCDFRFWTWDTVPAFADYRFFVPSADDDDAEEAMNDTTEGAFVPMGDEEVAVEGTRVVEEGCGSDKIECPYCVGSNSAARYENDDFTAHLASAHKIDNFARVVKAFRKEDGTAPGFHELVQLVNMIREKTDAGVTPYSGIEVNANGPSSLAEVLLAEFSTSPSASSPSAADLAKVYVVSPESYAALLADAPNEDYYLLPKRPNDSLITYLLHADDEDGDEDEGQEEFPMVPTVRETAAAQSGSHE